MTNLEYRMFLDLLMCSDPWPVETEGGNDGHVILLRLADKLAQERGTAGRATKFCGTAEPGQTGVYLYPCPGSLKGEDWHLVGFGAWDVPLHRSHFEIIA